ncbi:282_t:CDS:1 [Diversispora eburnea]|uniref:282_t:CDS:1 n=1 Tax=Diversispora eburnea TaxID=1213867 RepID=A0A9N8VQ95_9GLOM|nr:282_t:CDS:1 [Diversispora eburnea]
MIWNITKSIKRQQYFNKHYIRNISLKSPEFKFPCTIEELEEGFQQSSINNINYNKDESNLFLQICKSIFKDILLGERNLNFIFNNQIMKQIEQVKMIHRTLDKNISIEENINKEFQNIFNLEKISNLEKVSNFEYIYNDDNKEKNIISSNNKDIEDIGSNNKEENSEKLNENKLMYCQEIDQPLIENLLLISRKWYYPFTEYLQKLHKSQWQKFNTSSLLFTTDIMERKLKRQLITNTNKYIPGFKYLFQNDWQVIDKQSQYGQGDLIFASDYGILLVVEVKYLNPKQSRSTRKGRNMRRNFVKEQTEKYKFKAMEKFLNVNVAVIGAYFINEIDWDKGTEKETLVFIGEIDEMIAKAVNKLENDFKLQRRNEGMIFIYIINK